MASLSLFGLVSMIVPENDNSVDSNGKLLLGLREKSNKRKKMTFDKNLRLCPNSGNVHHGINDSLTTRQETMRKRKLGGNAPGTENEEEQVGLKWLQAGLGKNTDFGKTGMWVPDISHEKSMEFQMTGGFWKWVARLILGMFEWENGTLERPAQQGGPHWDVKKT